MTTKKSPSFALNILVFSLLLVGGALLYLHISQAPKLYRFLVPELIYKFDLEMVFDSDGDVEISTFIPQDGGRQEILSETIRHKNMVPAEQITVEGRRAEWRGGRDAHRISYSALLVLRPVEYDLSTEIRIPREYGPEFEDYLSATGVVQVDHPEIRALWESIKPVDSGSALGVLHAIYTHIYSNIENKPFKGVTDSLTALRLGAASCNGKSRLFVSLARLNNLPARLVGGVVLDGRRKKTSHQWVEVYVEGHWIPFDALNGHFARLPGRYLELYRGDHQLFKHSTDINFQYFFNSDLKNVAPALYRSTSGGGGVIPNAANVMTGLGLPIVMTYVFLLFPLCALLITFLKNVIGVKTFGTFMPMLIAAACIHTGLIIGVAGFFVVLLLAFGAHVLLGRLHILKVSRLASIITIIPLALIFTVSLVDSAYSFQIGLLAIFPAVIISFTADRIHQMSVESKWDEALTIGLGTVVTIALCFFVFDSILFQGLISLYPEVLFLVLGAQIYIGGWSGMRVSEIFRFRRLDENVMGINSRNRDFIYRYNDEVLLSVATDKITTKRLLSQQGIPVPETRAVCRSHSEIDQFMGQLQGEGKFVIKPNRGSQGNGILLLEQIEGDGFRSTSGKFWSRSAVRRHVAEILAGSFSQSGSEDEAYSEPMIAQHELLRKLSPTGLCDLRLMVCNGYALSAMLRIPTLKSDGKANLHQGAVGASVDMETGCITRAVLKGIEQNKHPDTDVELVGVKIPFWGEIVEMAESCYSAIALGYMGVDICIDEQLGPLVLEVNGRPGLEIQNVGNRGLGQVVSDAY